MNTIIQASFERGAFHKFLVTSTLFVALLFTAVTSVHADGSRDRYRSEWRLGERYQIFHRTDRGWHRVQGSAIAVGDGWVIGTDRRDGGYGIYRWNGYRFERMPGAAVEIGGSYERPWVVNNRGERFEWTGRGWREIRRANAFRDDRDHDRRENHYDDYRNDRRSRW